jgi:23S rRNA pseudouridine2457 synthase
MSNPVLPAAQTELTVPHRYFILNKPVGMVSQFVSTHEVGLLGDLDFDFPLGTHAIGRLDKDSEGLLLLTTDKRITKLLFQGEKPHKRSYLVLVKGVVTPETLQQLTSGVAISGVGGSVYTTQSCEAELVADPQRWGHWIESYPAHIPHSWLLLTLTEGRFHQVRKMVFTVGHRCKRLIRVGVEELVLNGLLPGSVTELPAEIFYGRLKL